MEFKVVDVDLILNDFQICCKPNRQIFQKIYNFLSNPFFQINEFACPNKPSTFGFNQVKLPTLGIISMKYSLAEYPECSKGILGLSKKSQFLRLLPVNYQIFSIFVNKLQGSNYKKFTLKFGNVSHSEISFTSQGTFKSENSQLWDLHSISGKLGSLEVSNNFTLILTTNLGGMRIPEPIYENLSNLFVSSQSCIKKGFQIYCPCQSGIPHYFPSFFLDLDKKFNLQIQPKKFFQEDSAVCKLLITKGKSSFWEVDVSLFENTIFKFDKENKQITITKENSPVKEQSSNFIQLPIQLILNCFVILLMCVFVSLIIIEIIKRVSGLSEVSNETFRDYMIRKNMQQQ